MKGVTFMAETAVELLEHERVALAAIKVANSPNHDLEEDSRLRELLRVIGSLAQAELVSALALITSVRTLPHEEWWRLGMRVDSEPLAVIHERLQATSFGVEDIVLGALSSIIAGNTGTEVFETYPVHAVHHSQAYPDKHLRSKLGDYIEEADASSMTLYGRAWWERVAPDCLG